MFRLRASARSLVTCYLEGPRSVAIDCGEVESLRGNAKETGLGMEADDYAESWMVRSISGVVVYEKCVEVSLCYCHCPFLSKKGKINGNTK